MSDQPETAPEVLMARILPPIPVREFAAIGKALDALAKEDGCKAYVRQVGSCYEVYKVPCAQPGTPT
jgi:hypothetical protein